MGYCHNKNRTWSWLWNRGVGGSWRHLRGPEEGWKRCEELVLESEETTCAVQSQNSGNMLTVEDRKYGQRTWASISRQNIESANWLLLAMQDKTWIENGLEVQVSVQKRFPAQVLLSWEIKLYHFQLFQSAKSSQICSWRESSNPECYQKKLGYLSESTSSQGCDYKTLSEDLSRPQQSL